MTTTVSPAACGSAMRRLRIAAARRAHPTLITHAAFATATPAERFVGFLSGAITMRFSALALVLASGVGLSSAHAAGLPDSGQGSCDNGANVMVACSAANSGNGATYPRQDGRFGRDAKAAAGALIKVGAGAAGFDYTKVANNGTDVPAGTALGANAADWACTRDNATGLTWEVKTTDGGLRDWSRSYAWYDTNGATNGGVEGYAGADTCGAGGGCNTEALTTAVNAAALCAYTDWRVPTYRELFTLVNYGPYTPGIPSIDTTYFPNTLTFYYWTASTVAREPRDAWLVDFDIGNSYHVRKPMFVLDAFYPTRLVRGVPF